MFQKIAIYCSSVADKCCHMYSVAGQPVALLVNNLGGTSVLELNIVAKEAIMWLGTYGI